MKTATHALTRVKYKPTEKNVLIFEAPKVFESATGSFGRTANLFFLKVSFVFAGIELFEFEACTSWETCYPCREARGSDHRSVGKSGSQWQVSWRFEIDQPKVLKEARRCQSIRKLLFPVARARAKCGRNGQSMQIHLGIRVRQTPKVRRVRSSFGRAGETKFALKWGGRRD